jgi:hypothetical protein
MTDLLREPFAVWIVAGLAVSLALTRTRFANWSLPAMALVFLASIELACFDGKRHPTEKFDATFFVWARAVELRALGGLAIMLMGGPCGTVVANLVHGVRGRRLGAAVAGPFGLGLLASSVWLQFSMRTILHEGTPPETRFAHLQAAVARSTWLLSAGTTASIVICASIVVALVRRQAVSSDTAIR